MSENIKQVKVGQNYLMYHETKGSKERIFLNLHGYAAVPEHYHRNTALNKEHATLIQPIIFGCKYFKNQPITVDEHTELMMHFLETDAVKERCTIIGHSYGGAVGIKMSQQGHEKLNGVLSINPAIKQDYGILGLAARTTGKTLNEATGLAKSEYLPAKLLYEAMMPAIRCMKKKREITKAQLRDMLDIEYNGEKMKTPARLLYGIRDEIFEMDAFHIMELAKIGLTDIKEIDRFNHDWPLLNPRRCLEEILDFVNGIESRQ